MTNEELAALPVTVDLVTAGRAFGMGRDLSYQLHREGHFPCPVLALGRRLVVPTAGIRQALLLNNNTAGV